MERSWYIATMWMGHYRRILGKYYGPKWVADTIFIGFEVYKVDEDMYNSLRVGDEY